MNQSLPAHEAYLAGRRLAMIQSIDPTQAEPPPALAAERASFQQGVADEQQGKPLPDWAKEESSPDVQGESPEGTIARLYQAVLRSVKYLPEAAQAKFAELLQPEVLWTFAIIIGLWAGLQLIPAGPIVDAIMAAIAGYALVKVFGDLKDAVLAAAAAKTNEELESAAKQLAKVWAEIGVDTLIGLTSGFAFKSIQKAVLRIRPLVSTTEAAAAEISTVSKAKVRAAPKVPGEPASPAAPVSRAAAEAAPAAERAAAAAAPAAEAELAGSRALTIGRRPGRLSGAISPSAAVAGAAAAAVAAPVANAAAQAGEGLKEALTIGKWVLLAGAGGLVLYGGYKLAKG